MKKQKSRQKKIEKKQGGLPFPYYVLMVPVIMGFALPLIVRGYVFEIADVFSEVSLSRTNVATDVFLHGKQTWLYWTMGIALFLLLCFKLLERKVIYPKKWMIFGGIYLLLSLISALLAEDVGTALFGGEDMFQGYFVLLAYFVLFYYVYMIFCGEKKQQTKMIYLFLRCGMILTLLLSILGIFQMCGNDPFSWGWVQKLCNMVGAQIVEDGRIYLTLYNSNYVGVIAVLLLPLLCVGLIVEKKKIMKVIYAIAVAGMCTLLVASGSKTAMTVIAILSVVGGIFTIVRSKQYRKVACIVLAIVIVLGTAFLTANKNTVAKINKELPQWNTKLNGMVTDKDFLRIKVKGQEIKISWTSDEIQIVDKEGNIYETKEVNETKRAKFLNKLPTAMTSYYGEEQFAPKRIAKKPFRDIIFFKSGLQYNGQSVRGYVFYINKQPFFITKETGEGGYRYYNLHGHFVEMEMTEDAFLRKAYGVASNRGYIWSKTIPLLKETILVGSGMDHFSLVFPNHDYVAKARIDKVGTIYNKPHSWYLQMGTESGMISLLCILIMLTYILREGIFGIRKNKDVSNIFQEEGLLKIVAIGLGVSIVGYCLINILYDQVIVTAPIFWMILGAYAGINIKLKEV